MIVITSVIVLMAIGLLTMAICLVKQQKKLDKMDDLLVSSLGSLGKTVADLSDEVQGLAEDMTGVMEQVDTLGSQFQEGDPVCQGKSHIDKLKIISVMKGHKLQIIPFNELR